MKRAIVTLSVLILFAFVLLSYSQQSYEFVRADIPFDFQVNGQNMPAGRYDFCWNRAFVAAVRLAEPSATTSQPIRFAHISTIDEPKKNARPTVVFHRLGSQYFLAEIHQPGSGFVTITVSRQELNQRLALTKVEVPAEGK
jgi:hypothetical protein